MQEPDVNRGSLFFWMPVSLSVGIAILWLSLGLQPAGAEMMRASELSAVGGAMGFTFLLVWAAYAYAISITTPHKPVERVYLWSGLILPLLIMLLLWQEQALLPFLLGLVWLGVVITTAWGFARREPLAGIMLLPLIGSAFTGILFALTVMLLP